jgi:excisionase family DNA binding protein
MSMSWDDELLTVAEIAQHLKINQQTVRNWIDQGQLPAVRISRRVRVRRTDLEQILDQGTIGRPGPEPPPLASTAPDAAREQLAEALERAQRLLGRRSAVRRAELAVGLQDLTDAVAAGLTALSEDDAAPSAISDPSPDAAPSAISEASEDDTAA